MLANLVKWYLAAALGVAALAALVALSPAVLVYFLYSRTFDFIEFRIARKHPLARPDRPETGNMFNLASVAKMFIK